MEGKEQKQPQIIDLFGMRLKVVPDGGSLDCSDKCALWKWCQCLPVAPCLDAEGHQDRHFERILA